MTVLTLNQCRTWNRIFQTKYSDLINIWKLLLLYLNFSCFWKFNNWNLNVVSVHLKQYFVCSVIGISSLGSSKNFDCYYSILHTYTSDWLLIQIITSCVERILDYAMFLILCQWIDSQQIIPLLQMILEMKRQMIFWNKILTQNYLWK
jgi:hypothetical protein